MLLASSGAGVFLLRNNDCRQRAQAASAQGREQFLA